MSDSRNLSIGQLCRSPFNVRTNQVDINEVEAIERTILEREARGERGLIQSLVVHPMKGQKDRFGVHAGGRRYMAIKHLIERGELAGDYPVPVEVTDRSEDELLELSMIENLIRRSLHTYEEAAGVKRIADRGVAPADIARHLGQPLRWVEQNLRLANLAPAIFKAYSDGKLPLEHAKAFGATADQKLQKSAFDTYLRLSDHDRSVGAIHKLLKVGDREEARLLRFVGEEAYRDAGGTFELDLFADEAEHRGRVGEPGLLLELVDAKLDDARAGLRKRAAKEIRFEREYPRHSNYGGVDVELEITPATAIDPDIRSFVEDELFELSHLLKRAEDPEAIATIKAEIAEHEAKLAGPLDLPTGDIYATLTIEESGELEVRWWWASRKAMREAEKAAETAPAPAVPVPVSARPIATPLEGSAVGAGRGTPAQQQADAAAKADQALIAEAVHIVRAVRREMLRYALVEDGAIDVAHDFLIWQLLRSELAPGRTDQLGARGLARADDAPPFQFMEGVRDAIEETPAHDFWTSMLGAFRTHPAVALLEPVDAFRAFLGETREWKTTAAAAVAAMTLTKTANLDGYRLPIHDFLAAEAGLGDDEALRDLWHPTERFVALLPRAKRIELAAPHADEATVRSWGAMKAADTVAPITRTLRRACWVHPALQFRTTAPAEQVEAAE